MVAIKTETITVRIDPAVRVGLRPAAEKEHRSLAIMVEVMIRDYYGRQGIDASIDKQPLAEYNTNHNLY
jgi:hypothetical protein